jgi:hypothetical protein
MSISLRSISSPQAAGCIRVVQRRAGGFCGISS